MQRLEKIVEEYIKNDNRQTAMLINGKWGSGKTYFVKNTLIKQKTVKALKPIYVSLNGLDSLDDIPDKILASLSSVDPKTVNKIIDQVSSIPVVEKMDAAFKFVQLTFNNATKLYLPKRLKDAILFVDDLERVSSKLPIEDVLGYICTNYMEACHTKVVFICNEDEIAMKDKYQSIKEKTISITTDFEPSLNEIIGSFVGKIVYQGNSTMQGYFEENKDEICTLFEDLEIINLRTVQSIIEVFHAVIMRLPENPGEDVLTKIFRFIVAIQNEYDLGKLKYKDKEILKLFKKSISLLGVYELNKEFEEKYPAEAYFKRFKQKYYQSSKQEWFFLSSIFEYQVSRYMDVNMLTKEIEIISGKANPYTSALNRLFFIWQIEKEDEARNLLYELSKYVDSSRYDILGLRNLYYLTQDDGLKKMFPDIINRIENSIKTEIIKLFDKFDNHQDLTLAKRDLDHVVEMFGTKGIFEESAEELVAKAKSRIDKKQVIEFLDSLDNDEEIYRKGYETLQNNHKIFSMIVEMRICDRLAKLSNKANGELGSMLMSKIINISDAGKYRYGDLDAIDEIIKCLEENLSADEWKQMAQIRLINTFREAADHIKKDHLAKR